MPGFVHPQASSTPPQEPGVVCVRVGRWLHPVPAIPAVVHAPMAGNRSVPPELMRPRLNDDRETPLFRMNRVNISSPMFPVRGLVSHMSFEQACADPMIQINPKVLGFIPSAIWVSGNETFGNLVNTFFRRRNSSHSKFSYKLFNALRLSEVFPDFVCHVGIQWVTDHVFMVRRRDFARLIGVKTVEGGLFHQQGNFPSHGFIELTFAESDAMSRAHGFGPCDLSIVRFVHHGTGLFTRFSTEASLEQCRWSAERLSDDQQSK